MSFVFSPMPVVSVPVLGQPERFPVHRIYCVGRNYEEHAKEMGFTGREPPFFFLKPSDSLVVVEAGQTGTMPYPSLTQNLHHEIELVVAIGKGGRNISAADAAQHIYGYAVGLDMTRRDLQNEMKKQGRPWCIGKAFDHSAPIGPITPIAQSGDANNAEISLQGWVCCRRHRHSDPGILPQEGLPVFHRPSHGRARQGRRGHQRQRFQQVPQGPSGLHDGQLQRPD